MKNVKEYSTRSFQTADGRESCFEKWQGRMEGAVIESRKMNFHGKLRLLCWILIFFALLSTQVIRVQAADTINSVSISFKNAEGEEGDIEEPEVTASSNVEVSDVEYRKSVKNWIPGSKLRVHVRLESNSGEFSENFNRSKVKVSGATFVGVRRIDDDTLEVKVDYIPSVKLGTTTRAGWNSARTRAVWRKVDYAPGYNVNLYADDKKVKSFKNVKNTYLDLADYMTNSNKTYYYEVQATYTNNEEKKYITPGEFVTSEDETVSGSGSAMVPVKPGDTGNGPAADSPRNTWSRKNGQWYYYNGEGNPVTGWLNLNNKWYFMDGNGVMLTGWQNVGNGRWCYFTPNNGDMLANTWVHSGSDWYHVDGNGYMQTGWLPTTGNLWYYMDPGSGKMTTGWVRAGNDWYLMGTDGIMLTGWQSRNGRWYFMDTSGNGRMLTGWQTIGGRRYYLDPSDGHMLSNAVVDGVYLRADGAAE